MAQDLGIVMSLTLGGKNYSLNQTKSEPDLVAKEESVPVAWAGTLSTRTSDTAGTITMDDADHVITDADEVDIYWTDADGNVQRAHSATVGTVATTSVPFTGAEGTVLPAQDTVVQVCVQQAHVMQEFSGDDIASLVAACDIAAGTIKLVTAGAPDTTHLVIEIPPTGAYGWWGIGANPIAGDTIDKVRFTHNDTTSARNVRVAAQLDL